MAEVRVFVVEDEFLHAEHTKMSVEEAGFEVAGECANADEALVEIIKAKPDVVLMDISLPGKQNGITVAQALNEKTNIPVIFTSSLSDEDTLKEAAETAPVSYLVKPVQAANLKAAITLAAIKPRREANEETILEDEKLFIKSGNKLQKIRVGDILWVETAGDNYCKVVTAEHQLVSRHTVRQMSQLLPAESFIQSHRAYLVNLEKIESIHEKEQVARIADTDIPIGRSFKEALYARLKRL